MKKQWMFLLTFLLVGCVTVPEKIKPVKPFELEPYLGKWYEIARLDHSFERGLTQVTADYQLRKDGGIDVINRGFSAKESRWQQAKGKAYFVRAEDEGYLKVSFFGPFYGAYIIFELDKDNYQYAFVSGPTKDYLWLLSRTKEVDQHLIENFINTSEQLGYDTRQLIFSQQDKMD